MTDHITPANQDNTDDRSDSQPELAYWRVESSFYVQADSAVQARQLVAKELNSRPVQHLIGASLGDADVHDDVEPWDMQG